MSDPVTTSPARAPEGGQGPLPEITLVMPCLNEAETLASCLEMARRGLHALGRPTEIILADNGSSDGSPEIARRYGARVVSVPQRGYGAAVLGGVEAARTEFVILADSDGSHDLEHLAPFVTALESGLDLVVGNRFRGGIEPGGMAKLSRYIGNPLLTGVGRALFGSPVRDWHCGLRSFRRSKIQALGLRTSGFELTSEMILKAAISRLRIGEVPTRVYPAGRSRPPHLRPWLDGWRVLRFLVMFSPRFLFLFPGAILAAAGLLVFAWLLPGPRAVGAVRFDLSTLVGAAAAVILGVELVIFWVVAKMFAIREGILPKDPRLDRLARILSLEAGLVFSSLMVVAGLVTVLYGVQVWGNWANRVLNPEVTLRIVLSGVLAMLVGAHAFFASFLLAMFRVHGSR